MKKVKVKSLQSDVIVCHKGEPSFEFEFKSEPILMEANIAEFLAQNPNFKIIKGSEVDFDPTLDFNKDGKVDKKDASLGAKAMAKRKKQLKEGD